MLEVMELHATFIESEQLHATFGEVISVMPDPYEGSYQVTPTVEGLTLPTAKKNMARDLEVLEIPYAEVSNITGTTVVIAS